MKNIAVLILLLSLFSCTEELIRDEFNLETFVDQRDNMEYKYVEIGNQTWMAENLAYETNEGSMIISNSEDYLSIYGRLYTFEAAQNACPSGWHLPTDEEWNELADYISSINNISQADSMIWIDVAGHLKSKGNIFNESGLWYNKEGADGLDSFGFTALPASYYGSFDGEFRPIGGDGFWWTSTERSKEGAFICNINIDDNNLRKESNRKLNGYSIRCVRD